MNLFTINPLSFARKTFDLYPGYMRIILSDREVTVLSTDFFRKSAQNSLNKNDMGCIEKSLKTARTGKMGKAAITYLIFLFFL